MAFKKIYNPSIARSPSDIIADPVDRDVFQQALRDYRDYHTQNYHDTNHRLIDSILLNPLTYIKPYSNNFSQDTLGHLRELQGHRGLDQMHLYDYLVRMNEHLSPRKQMQYAEDEQKNDPHWYNEKFDNKKKLVIKSLTFFHINHDGGRNKEWKNFCIRSLCDPYFIPSRKQYGKFTNDKKSKHVLKILFNTPWKFSSGQIVKLFELPHEPLEYCESNWRKLPAPIQGDPSGLTSTYYFQDMKLATHGRTAGWRDVCYSKSFIPPPGGCKVMILDRLSLITSLHPEQRYYYIQTIDDKEDKFAVQERDLRCLT